MTFHRRPCRPDAVCSVALRSLALWLTIVTGCGNVESSTAPTSDAPPKIPMASTETAPDNFRFVGTEYDCPGAFDPVCRRSVICPTASDTMPPGSTGIQVASYPAASFCPAATAAGGITTTCLNTTVGYTCTNSPLQWQEACAVTGHGVYLASIDDGVANVALPFTTLFYGSPFTSVGLSSNGMLAFGAASSQWVNAPLPNSATPNAVFPFWDDLVQRTGICTATFGTAPNRSFVAEWSDAEFYGDSTANLTFEVALGETSNTIDVLYRSMYTGSRATGGHATVGIQSGTGGPDDLVGYDNATVASSGMSYRWTPAAESCASASYTQILTGQCSDLDPGDLPFWGQVQFTSVVPPGTSIHLVARTATTVAGLGSAVAVLLPDAPMGSPGAPSMFNLGDILRAASPNSERLPYLQLTATLDASAASNTAPILGGVEVRYDCNPDEYFYICNPGSPCNTGVPCRAGSITCPAPQRGACTDVGPAPAGTTCGSGQVCNATGSCITCTEGTACTVPGGCATGTTDCSTGAPVCVPTAYVAAGTLCGGAQPGYTRGSSPLHWVNACSTAGSTTWLAGSDDGTTQVTLPFLFSFYETPYIQASLSANGVLGFPGVANDWLNAPLPATDMSAAIFPFWDDLVLRSGVCTATVGTAPTREFVAEWNDASLYSDSTSNLTFEVALGESTGTVDVLWNTMTGSGTRPTGSHATLGIQQGAGPGVDMVAYDVAGAATGGSGYRWTPATPAGECNGLGACRACTAEICDGIDNNCNGLVDEGCPGTLTCPPAITVNAGSSAALNATIAGGIDSLTWSVTSGPTGAASLATWTPATALGPSVSITPALVGSYVVTATGTDGTGATRSCTVPVTVVTHGLRVELTWNGSGDLDLHLHDTHNTAWFDSDDCDYSNPASSFGAVLDEDNTTGNGPENLHVDSPTVGSTYTIGVANQANGMGRTATVSVFCTPGASIPDAVFTSRALNGAASGNCNANDFWRVGRVVFTSAGACTVTPIGTYTSNSLACLAM